MRPRLADGSFKKDFNALSTHGQGFIEGNSWNYSFFVPQNPDELIALMGGKRKNSLQNWMNCSPCIYLTNFCRLEDITREELSVAMFLK
jgi:putative alpha-1,2-mannosidase